MLENIENNLKKILNQDSIYIEYSKNIKIEVVQKSLSLETLLSIASLFNVGCKDISVSNNFYYDHNNECFVVLNVIVSNFKGTK